MTGARSTVKIAVCPRTTVRLVQVVVRTLCAVPVMGTVCGLRGALSVTLSDAVAFPPAVGVKVTLMVQEVSGESEEGHSLVWANSDASGPVIEIVESVSVVSPVLVSVTGVEALVPTTWGSLEEPKVTGDGLRVTAGPNNPTAVRATN